MAEAEPPVPASLHGLGGRLSSAEILQAVAEPSAAFSPGFKPVTLLLDSGTVVQGVENVAASDAQHIVVRTAGGELRIPRDTIEEFRIGVSDMPAGLVAGLTPAELNDLLAYLRSL